MKTIYLIEGEKNSGKSSFINKKYEELQSSTTEIYKENEDDLNLFIYVLQDNNTKDIIILNSGSDTKVIINNIKDVLKKYTANIIYTAIRPKDCYPNLHKWMIEALNIKEDEDIVQTIKVSRTKI